MNTSHLGGTVRSVWGGGKLWGIKFTIPLSDDALMQDCFINMILITVPCELIKVTMKNKEKRKRAP